MHDGMTCQEAVDKFKEIIDMGAPGWLVVELPVRELPDGTIRVGYEPPEVPVERFTFPVVPNEPEPPKGAP